MAPLVRPRWSPRGRCNHRHQLGCSSATSPRRSPTINPVSSPVTTTIRAARIDDAEKCVTRPVEAAISLTDNHVSDNIRNMIGLAPRRQSCDSPRTPPSGYINYRMFSAETRCVATSEDSRIYTWNWGCVPAVLAVSIRPVENRGPTPQIVGVVADNNDGCCSV